MGHQRQESVGCDLRVHFMLCLPENIEVAGVFVGAYENLPPVKSAEKGQWVLPSRIWKSPAALCGRGCGAD